MPTKFSFRSKVWKYQGKAGWYFVTLPKRLSKKIRTSHRLSEEGWGRLKTLTQLGKSKWRTAIWYDTKADSYLLPLKSEIRKREKIKIDTLVAVHLQFEPRKKLKKAKSLFMVKPVMWS